MVDIIIHACNVNRGQVSIEAKVLFLFFYQNYVGLPAYCTSVLAYSILYLI